MQNFIKKILIVLVATILFTSFISFNNGNNSNQNSLSEVIKDFEDDVEAGIIIEDGIINENNDYIDESGNRLSEAATSIGGVIVSIITKILEFFANLFGSLLS